MATRMSGYSSTIRKQTPHGKADGIAAGDSIKFTLPSNTLVDLRTLKLHMLGDTLGGGDGAVLFPQLATSLIDQIIVSANGVQIEATPRNWNQIVKMLDDFTSGAEKRRARTALFNEQVAGINPQTGDFYQRSARGENMDSGAWQSTAYPTLRPGARQTRRRMVVDEWPACFLGTVNPSIISTALTGDLTVELRFAPNSTLINVGVLGYMVPGDGTDWSAEGRPHFDGQESELFWAPREVIAPGNIGKATDARYVLNGVHMSVKTIDISDGQFYEWLKAEVPMSLPFQHFVAQPGQSPAAGSVDQTMTMTVNSASVDCVYGTFYGTDYQEGTLYPHGDTCVTDPTQKPDAYPNMPYTYRHEGSFGNAQTSRYFQRGSVYSRVDKPFESSFSINNVQMDYPADLPTLLAKTKDDFNLGRTGTTNINPRIYSLGHFAQAYFVATQKLNFNTGEADTSRILSGLDSRNATVHVQWKTSGATENDVFGNNHPIQVTPWLYASTTARLNIGAGRVLELVY
jgi:hypothetical protein